MPLSWQHLKWKSTRPAQTFGKLCFWNAIKKVGLTSGCVGRGNGDWGWEGSGWPDGMWPSLSVGPPQPISGHGLLLSFVATNTPSALSQPPSLSLRALIISLTLGVILLDIPPFLFPYSAPLMHWAPWKRRESASSYNPPHVISANPPTTKKKKAEENPSYPPLTGRNTPFRHDGFLRN